MCVHARVRVLSSISVSSSSHSFWHSANVKWLRFSLFTAHMQTYLAQQCCQLYVNRWCSTWFGKTKTLGLAFNTSPLHLRARKGKKLHPLYCEGPSWRLGFTHSPLLSTNQTRETLWEMTSFIHYVQYKWSSMCVCIHIYQTVLLLFVNTNNSLHTSH